MKTGGVPLCPDYKPDTKNVLAILGRLGNATKKRNEDVERAKSVEHEGSKSDMANEKALTVDLMKKADWDQEVVRL